MDRTGNDRLKRQTPDEFNHFPPMQPPGRRIVVTSARGHFNAIGERPFTDFRLGPQRPMQRLLDDVARDGAFVSINHALSVTRDSLD